MSVDATLVSAFNLLLQKAFRPDQLPVLRPANLVFEWSGGGTSLDVSTLDPVLIEVPFPCRLVWAHMWAGDGTTGAIPVQAAVDLRLTNITNFGVSMPVYQTGTPPVLADVAAMDLDLTDWLQNFTTGDTLIAFPTAFVGTATWLALTIQVRPTEFAIGINDVEDNASDVMTTNDGEAMVFRG